LGKIQICFLGLSVFKYQHVTSKCRKPFGLNSNANDGNMT